jgi:biopolymer transport protein ExbB
VLSEKLLGIALLSVDPILYVLLFMSFISFVIMVERLIVFSTFDETLSRANIKLQLEKRLGILATFGNNAPFIGLFGTVLGVINAFHSLGDENSLGVATIMGGISEALVATATGLFVAIPSVMAYNYFVRRIKMILLEQEAKNEL